MTYFLSIYSGEEILRDQEPFEDFAEAIAACGEYYEPRARGSVLSFTSVVTGKQFMRSYAQLMRIDDLSSDVAPGSPQAMAAIKQGNAFSFARSYHFLIESQAGLQQRAHWQKEDDQEQRSSSSATCIPGLCLSDDSVYSRPQPVTGNECSNYRQVDVRSRFNDKQEPRPSVH